MISADRFPPDRFDSLTQRINELQPPGESPSEGKKSPTSSSETLEGSSSAEDDDRGVAKTPVSDDVDKRGPDDAPSGEVKGGEEGKTTEDGGDGGSKEPETEEEKRRREEVYLLEDQRGSIMLEMLTCSQFHHVFEDSNADDGLVPDMSDEEGDGDSSSAAGKGEDSTAAVEEKGAKEDSQQQPADENAQK